MAGSNLSLQYLNYPTQVVFKSCKLIPVMVCLRQGSASHKPSEIRDVDR